MIYKQPMQNYNGSRNSRFNNFFSIKQFFFFSGNYNVEAGLVRVGFIRPEGVDGGL